MIQRIQTIFLFASVCFLASIFFVPVAGLIGDAGDVFTFTAAGFYRSTAQGVDRINVQYSVTALGILICVLNFANIFMYKRRKLQMRLCVYTIVLLVGLSGIDRKSTRLNSSH